MPHPSAPHPDAAARIEPSLLPRLRAREPLLWPNPHARSMAAGAGALEPGFDIGAASARFERFRGLMRALFPALEPLEGAVASELRPLTRFAAALGGEGAWFLKGDHALPVAGSVKARGGFHEVLAHAERLALANGLLHPQQDPIALQAPEARAFFSRHTISVGSTGNLGLGIGLIAAGLGFQAEVHMSADAKAWKKQRLRDRGIRVVEHAGDFADALAGGRRRAEGDPLVHFVDDERSADLFLGYAVAARELAQQLAAIGRTPSPERPLFVHLPCGVGGSPGGITYGLKALFGDAVHAFFAEPVAAPCMLVQLSASGQGPLSVYDIGLDNRTDADGLAVAQASHLVAPLMRRRLGGVFTVRDEDLLRDVRRLQLSEQILLEPSAIAGARGPLHLMGSPEGRAYLQRHGLTSAMADATHVVWATGGALVPEAEHARCQALGERLLQEDAARGAQCAA